MSERTYEAALNPGADGVTVTSGAASASVTIPNNTAGGRARAVRLQCTGNVYVKFSAGASTCTNANMLLSPNFDVIVNCKQFDTISYLQESVAAKLNILPLEL